MNVVGYMLVMISHELGDDKCVVVVKLLCFGDFCGNELKQVKFEFYEFEWIDEVIRLSLSVQNFYFEIKALGVKSFW